MKRLSLFIAIIAFLFLITFVLLRNTANDKEKKLDESPAITQNRELIIKMTATGYDPRQINVAFGDRVTFVNQDTNLHWPASNIHPTHEIYPEFDSQKAIAPGESWTFEFTKKGIWRYHDHLSPAEGGSITVE